MKLKPILIPESDGASLMIREVVPGDRRLLELGFSHLSQRSRYFRFLAAHPKLTADDIARFTAANSEDHVAIGALCMQGHQSDPVGIARFIRLADRESAAEFAITIVDRYQGRGIGSTLLGVLAKFGRRVGLSEFIGLVHVDNELMLRMLEQLGGHQTAVGRDEVEVSLKLFEDGDFYPETSVGRRVRTAYELAEIS